MTEEVLTKEQAEAFFLEEATKEWGGDAGADAPAVTSKSEIRPDPVELKEESEEASQDESEAKDEAEPPDPWAAVPDVVRKQFETLQKDVERREHAIKSDMGRRVSELQKKLDEANAKLTQREPAASPKTTQKWDEVKEEFQPIAEGVEEFVRSMLPSGTPEIDVEAKIKQFNDAQRTRQMRETVALFYDDDLDVDELLASEKFAGWFKKQPEDVQQLGYSDRIKDGKKLIDKYLTAEKAAKEAADKALKVKRDRDERLKKSTAVEGDQAPGIDREPGELTVEEIWNQEARKIWADT